MPAPAAPAAPSALRKTPARHAGALSTKSAPVSRHVGAVRKAGGPPLNGAVKFASGAAAGAANGAAPHLSPYDILAGRIANRVAEMAETYTFVEKPKSVPPPVPAPEPVTAAEKKRPRKLEIRLQNSPPESGSFSPAFLDSLLKKMLDMQNRMLRVSAELGGADDVSDEVKREQFQQTSELSRIIALICAEKARQAT